MEKTNISVILPVHSLDETTTKLLDNAILSVTEQVVRPDELVIVVPKGSDVAAYVKAYDYSDYKDSVTIAENDGATDFADELGVLDLNALLTYQNFNTDGMVIRKSVYDDFGGFKPSIKLTFIYEFLLRMTFKDAKVFVIPRFGYKHVNQRVGSLFSTYKETLDPAEARWWLAQAKKEYYFPKDRNITYEVQNG